MQWRREWEERELVGLKLFFFSQMLSLHKVNLIEVEITRNRTSLKQLTDSQGIKNK